MTIPSGEATRRPAPKKQSETPQIAALALARNDVTRRPRADVVIPDDEAPRHHLRLPCSLRELAMRRCHPANAVSSATSSRGGRRPTW